MSSPAKQPSIHAFFGGAKKPSQNAKQPSKEAKKPSKEAKQPSQEAKTDKLKPSQIQNIDKKRSAPTSPTADKNSVSQEPAPTTPLKRIKRNHEESNTQEAKKEEPEKEEFKESTKGLEDSDVDEDVPNKKQFRNLKGISRGKSKANRDEEWESEDASGSSDEEADMGEPETEALEDDVGSEEEPQDDQEGAPKSKLKKQKVASKKTVNNTLKKQSKNEKGKVDGVGAGAVAAAALHTEFDIDALIKGSAWKKSEPVPYAFLVAAFNEIAPQPKRLAIIATLTNTFRCVIRLTPDDLLPIVYLCTSRVAPPYSGKELGIGDAILIKSVAQASGRQEAQVKKEYNELGDLGEVACNSKGKQRTMFAQKPLTVRGVFKQLKDIASIEGHKSQDQKKSMIMKLLSAAKDAEAGFIVRSMQGKLRIGLAEQSVLVALAQAVALELAKDDSNKLKGEALANKLESASMSVRTAYGQCPSYDMLIPALLEHGVEDLSQHVHFAPGIPIKAMLARPTNGVTEVLDKFSGCEFTCEYKYDGERAQVHVQEDGTVHVYSRNLENTTSKYPDVVARMKDAMAPGVKSVVLDGEVQAWDTEKKVFLPFQVLTTRKRKDVAEDQIKVQVVLYCFDCLYLDGEVLLKKPLRERREALYKAMVPQEGKVQFATCKTSRDVEELQAFLDESVAASTEGLIVKTLADPYEPSKRSLNWLKLKKDYLEGCGDTFDVTVIGALHGKGKRTGGFGSFLLAIYDTEAEEFQTISKIGTGFSEELIKELSDQLKDLVIPKPPPYYRVTDKLVPDVWIEAKVVWEVKAADLSVSPVYTAGIGKVDSAKGISIRFPRLVRVRDDKTSEETTSPDQVADMYRNQAVINTSAKTTVDDDFW